MSTEVLKKPRTKMIILGILIGIVFAVIGTALLSIFSETVATVMIPHYSFSFYILSTVFQVGCYFSVIPAGIAGLVLALLIYKTFEKGLLTTFKAQRTGVSVALITIILICIAGIGFIIFAPHNYLFLYLSEIRQGIFFQNFAKYLLDWLGVVVRLLPYILFVTTIACIFGGLAGRLLARQLLPSRKKEVEHSPDLQSP